MVSGNSKSGVVRPGHPSFFRAAVLAAVLAVAGLMSSSALAAANGGYRLAGVVAVGADYLGFLEMPGGGQVLVRKGTVIAGGGRVVALNGERLQIVFPDRTVELQLEGSGRPGAPPNTQGVRIGPPDDAHISIQVDAAALGQAIKTAPPGGKSADAGVDVGNRFASLIDLPNHARVLAVNQVPVTSADQAIRVAEKSLAEGYVTILNLASPGGHPDTRVYLIPARGQPRPAPR
jgi:hypothetical protein